MTRDDLFGYEASLGGDISHIEGILGFIAYGYDPCFAGALGGYDRRGQSGFELFLRCIWHDC